MGATQFTTEATGTTAEEAFRVAVDDAFYWNGHAGYTGTIAEKDGFELWDLPTLPAKTNTPVDPSDLTDRYANAIEFYHDHVVLANGNDPASIHDATSQYDNTTTSDALLLVNALGADNMKALTNTYDEKWGPAVAVKLSDDTYGFFGYASC